MTAYLTIDGSHGEGGGQILRTSLALSAITGTPIHISNIRARRRKPGLMRQHLTSVHAAARVCNAAVEGAALKSGELWFRPSQIQAGEYHFAIGTAGSTSLVFQTVLPPLLMASGRSRVIFEGGTHNPMSPPYDFIAGCFLPVLARMGASVQVQLKRPGFVPVGGGRFIATIEPWQDRREIHLDDGGAVLARRARVLLAKLDRGIAERELGVIRDRLGWHCSECTTEIIDNSASPGNVLFCHIEREHITEIVTSFGEKGVPAEKVAMHAVREIQRYLDAGVAVGEHLADQLMVPMALAGAGSYLTLPLSLHAQTNKEIIEMFLPVDIGVEERAGKQRNGARVLVTQRRA